jgi:hypothetical protein
MGGGVCEAVLVRLDLGAGIGAAVPERRNQVQRWRGGSLSLRETGSRRLRGVKERLSK